MEFCVGIVLYKPNYERLKQNIEAIEKQVSKVYFFENGYINDIKIQSLLKSNNKFVSYISENNVGMAAALNKLIRIAYQDNFRWILTLDQDSVVSLNIISEYKKFIYKEKLAILVPRIVDINNNNLKSKNELPNFQIIKNPEDVISSGSLINIGIFMKIDGFNEKLFIDFVDTDYQKRVLDARYFIIKVNSTKISHSVGHIKTYNILSKKVICTNHSAFRRYYMVRNRLYYRKKYFGKKALLREEVRLILGTFKILIFERNKLSKIRSTINGFKDYKNLF